MVKIPAHKKIAEQQLQLRKSLWPDVADDDLWTHVGRAGYLKIPRAMPIILRIADMLAPKGKPVAQTYFDLWCRTFENSFIVASKPREMAYFSGFSGERAIRTWTSRLQNLKENEFIDYREGTTGSFHYILLFDPYKVIKRHHESGKLEDAPYNALQERMIEIKAN